MIRYIENIDLVTEFRFINSNLFVLTNNEIINVEKSKKFKGQFYCIRNWKDFLLTQNKKEDNILVLDKDLKIIKEITGASNYALWLLNSCSLIPVEDKVFEITDSLSLAETEVVIFPKDCIHKYGFRRAKNTILCDELDNGQLKWKFELGDNVKVGGDFILMDKLIVVSTTTDQDLIGIEIETGKELWRLSNCNLHHQQQPNTNYLIGLSANSFGDNFYQVIDPINGERIVNKKFENFFYETTPNLACITETHYYFISNVLGDGTGIKSEKITHLGCINLQTHEVEWVERIKGNGYLRPEVHNDKFYLLDGEQTLQILETT